MTWLRMASSAVQAWLESRTTAPAHRATSRSKATRRATNGSRGRRHYSVKWLVKPLAFKQLEKPREAQQNYQTNWPTDDQSAAGQPIELQVVFSVR